MFPEGGQIGVQPHDLARLGVEFLHHPTPPATQIEHAGSGGEMVRHPVSIDVGGRPPARVLSAVAAAVGLLFL